MMSKIKNLILFIVIGAILIFGYLFFFQKGEDEPNLVSSSDLDPITTEESNQEKAVHSDEFLTVLLSVNNIKLDDSIFSSNSFSNLKDSSVLLVAPGDEGRPNPFAPIGSDGVSQYFNSESNGINGTTPDTQI